MGVTPKYCCVGNRCKNPGALISTDVIAANSNYRALSAICDKNLNTWMCGLVDNTYGRFMWGTYDPDTGALSYGGQYNESARGGNHCALYPPTQTWLISVDAYSSCQVIYGTYDYDGKPTKTGSISGFYSTGYGSRIQCDAVNGIWWYGYDSGGNHNYNYYGVIDDAGVPVKIGQFAPEISGNATNMVPMGYDPYLGLIVFAAGGVGPVVCKYNTATGAYIPGSTVSISDALYDVELDMWLHATVLDPVRRKAWLTRSDTGVLCKTASYDDEGHFTLLDTVQSDFMPWSADFDNKLMFGYGPTSPSIHTSKFCF